MSDSGIDTADLTSLQSLASQGIDTYAQTVADQTNLARLQAGVPPLPVSYFDANPFAAAVPTPSGTGAPLSPFAPVATGVSPLFLLLLALGAVYFMDKK